MTFQRDCQRCGETFAAEGNRAKFCSKSCKNAVGYARRVGRELTEVRAQPKRASDACAASFIVTTAPAHTAASAVV